MNPTAKTVLQNIGLLLAAIAAIFVLLLVLSSFTLLGFTLFGAMTAPFMGFTFTDAIDFGPAAVIAIALVGLAARHALRPHPEAWLRFARRAAYVLTVLPPAIYLGTLYLLAWYGSRAIGHFPQPMIDDPKNIAGHNAPYQTMYHVVDYTEAFVGALVWVWAALLLHLRRRLTGVQWAILVAVFLLSWTVFMIEPGRRFEWWLD